MLCLYLYILDFCVLRTDRLRTGYRLKALNTAYQRGVSPFLIGHKSCNVLGILTTLTLQKELQNCVTNNVF